MSDSIFVDTSRVAVSEDGNTIYVKRQMDFGTVNMVRDEIFRLNMRSGTPDSVGISQGAYDIALMVHNIVAWEGPRFTDPVTGKTAPCTAENIRRFKPKDPLVKRVLEKINELNEEEVPDPKPQNNGFSTMTDDEKSHQTADTLSITV